MGLLRTAARASVAARVVGNVQRKQQLKWNAQDAAAAQAQAAAAVAAPAPASAPPAAPVGSQALIDQLTQLGQLRDSGVLTPEEFEAQKQRLLAG
jgi:hypothetical protein